VQNGLGTEGTAPAITRQCINVARKRSTSLHHGVVSCFVYGNPRREWSHAELQFILEPGIEVMAPAALDSQPLQPYPILLFTFMVRLLMCIRSVIIGIIIGKPIPIGQRAKRCFSDSIATASHSWNVDR